MIFLISLLTFVVAFHYASIFEWWLHKNIMHKAFGILKFAYTAHALTHHKIFKFDETYHLLDAKDKWTIPMAWWNGIVLVLVSATPFYIIGWLTGYPKPIIWTAIATIAAYYCIYERAHWCMHLPRPQRKRLIEQCLPFKWLNGHHILHHRYHGNNLNVVYPFMDWLMGTLILRSKFKFTQPKGPLVPDLQPLEEQKELSLVE